MDLPPLQVEKTNKISKYFCVKITVFNNTYVQLM